MRPMKRPPLPKNEPTSMNSAPIPASRTAVFTPFLNMPKRVDLDPECELSAGCGHRRGFDLFGVHRPGDRVVVGDQTVGHEVVQPGFERAHALGATGGEDVEDLVGLALAHES